MGAPRKQAKADQPDAAEQPKGQQGRKARSLRRGDPTSLSGPDAPLWTESDAATSPCDAVKRSADQPLWDRGADQLVQRPVSRRDAQPQ